MSTTCPAVMLAANRKERVIGRIRHLRVSIRTNAGARAFGALLGTKWAKNILKLKVTPDRISPSHRGSPSVIEKIK